MANFVCIDFYVKFEPLSKIYFAINLHKYSWVYAEVIFFFSFPFESPFNARMHIIQVIHWLRECPSSLVRFFVHNNIFLFIEHSAHHTSCALDYIVCRSPLFRTKCFFLIQKICAHVYKYMKTICASSCVRIKD